MLLARGNDPKKGDVVTYKGRPYRVLFAGPTRYGPRAHLEFMNGSKSFWVDLSLVTPSQSSGGRGRGYGGRGKRTQFRYWNGRTEWMSEEDADMAEDMGQGTSV